MNGTAGPARRSGPSLASILESALECTTPALPTWQWRIVRALCSCRTRARGGHRYECLDCGATYFVPHSCGNRHCPACQGQAARHWLAAQLEALLPVPYFHLVFTLPHALNPVIRQNQRALFTLLFQSVSQTLLEFGRRRWGAQLGITAMLHTWSQTLLDHYHLHCIVSGGGLSTDGSRWINTPTNYLFAVRALSAVYRGKFCAALQQLYRDGQLQFHGQTQALARPEAFARLLRQATRHRWVVYAKRPFGGPQQVLRYLSYYTHRVAISPRRLLTLDRQAQTVSFLWKDYAHGDRHQVMTLSLKEFLRRFCLHLLPERFVKIRHYGFLGTRQRSTQVPLARGLLAAAGQTCPPLEPSRPARPARVCPFCGSDQLVLIELVPPCLTPRLDSS